MLVFLLRRIKFAAGVAHEHLRERLAVMGAIARAACLKAFMILFFANFCSAAAGADVDGLGHKDLVRSR